MLREIARARCAEYTTPARPVGGEGWGEEERKRRGGATRENRGAVAEAAAAAVRVKEEAAEAVRVKMAQRANKAGPKQGMLARCEARRKNVKKVKKNTLTTTTFSAWYEVRESSPLGPMHRALALFCLPFALSSNDACSSRTAGVPCLRAAHCSLPRKASFSNFQVSNAAGNLPAAQPTNGTLCYDELGVRVAFLATDTHIFSPYTACDATTWAASDTVEVFAAPVLATTDNPVWYFELDTVPTGAMYGGLVNNSKGNASTCIDEHACAASGPLPCTGASAFAHGMTARTTNGTGFWTSTYFIPWAVFLPEFQPRSGVPWPLWRFNFYRYDYPAGPNESFDNYELSAWSPTHSPSFHEPSRFGVVIFE